MDEQEGRWITTKYGARVFIKNTNAYMNDKIRNSSIKAAINDQKEILEENQAIHYGDLGKARDTYYWAINSSNRSTGHFGTGTYFISSDEDKRIQNSSYFTRGDRPRKVVDFSQYKLYKPMIDSEAMRLHDGLKAINYNNYDSYDFRAMKDDLKRNGISEEKINNAIRKVDYIRKEYSSKNYDSDYEGKYDSLSTVFMKELGYNGIDVRGLDQLDNTGYGSVIYDLNNKIRS